MKKKLVVFVALATLSLPMICLADPPRPGPYASGFIGLSLPMGTDVTSTTLGPGSTTFNDRVEFDTGIHVGGAGGYDFGFLRLEGELSYKNGEISKITEQNRGTRITAVDGRLGATALMCNLFFDIHNATPVTPYIGGGAGFATLYLSDTYGREVQTGDRVRVYRSGDDSVFAYQVGAGLEIAFNRRFSLDLGYRYFGTTKAKFNSRSSMETELRLESHNAAVGFRVKF